MGMLINCPDCGHGLQPDGAGAYKCRCGFLSEPIPDVMTMQEWELDGGCETPCGCWTEMDGRCEHGNPSWALVMGLI